MVILALEVVPLTKLKPFLFFDFDDTLVDFQACARVAMKVALTKLGQSYTDEDYQTYQEINHGWWKRLEAGEITRDELRFGRIRDFFSAMEWTHLDPTLGTELFMQELGGQVVLYPDAQPVVLELQAQGWKIGLISNGLPDVQPQRISLAGFEGIFDPAIISGQVGFQKPDSRIFTLASSRARKAGRLLADQKIIMIGDNPEADIRGAREVGWETLQFVPEKTPPGKGQFSQWADFLPALEELVQNL